MAKGFRPRIASGIDHPPVELAKIEAFEREARSVLHGERPIVAYEGVPIAALVLKRRAPGERPWRFEEFWPEWLRLTTSVDQSKAKSGFPPTRWSCAGGWGQDELRKITTWRAAHPAV